MSIQKSVFTFMPASFVRILFWKVLLICNSKNCQHECDIKAVKEMDQDPKFDDMASKEG